MMGTMSNADLLGTPSFSGGLLCEEMEALSDMMEESMEMQGRGEATRQAQEEERAAGVQGRLGPGDIGPKKEKKKPNEVPPPRIWSISSLDDLPSQKKQNMSNDIWDVEEVPEENLSWEDEGDERPEPE